MKKRLLYAASVAAIALTACTSEEYLGGLDAQGTEAAIGFASATKAVTRGNYTGTTAAEKLHNNFVVYGFKTNNDTEAADASTDQKVFDLYNVNYIEGSAYTTESNTAGWEYVSYANHNGKINPQTIKYWDHSAKNYVFSAVAGTGIKATKIEKDVPADPSVEGSVYGKGWNVEIPAGGSLGDLYASDRKVVAPGDYGKQVDLTFRSIISKVRFAIYETVPGYEVHIDRFWTGEIDGGNYVLPGYSDTNFEIKGKFKTANANAVTPLTITYYGNGSEIENRPKVTFVDSNVTTNVYGEFGANIQATKAIGTTSVEATYDQSDKSYTMILPYEATDNVLKLKVNYTLTSTDGSGETIKVYGATAYVPAQYTQWKPNFAYTYIFKISDKTNGTTVTPSDPDKPNDPNDPDDPNYDPDGPHDPVGLSPITFDAFVVADEDGIQETITTVSTPSITTYQVGKVVTENNEYQAGNIYVTTMAGGSLVTMNAANAHVFEVVNNGTETLTEAVTENYLNNFCTLTEVVKDITVTAVPLNDGTNLTFTAGQVLKFTAEAGKTYAYSYFDGTQNHYKVIKVVSGPASVSYTVNTDALGGTATTATAISATDGTATIYVAQGGIGVLGVTPNFTISSDNGNKALKIVETAIAGVYTVSVDAAAIKAGKANDTYTVTFNGESVTIPVNITYVLRNAADNADVTAVTITAGNTTGVTVINKIADSAADGDVTEVPAGITIEKTATGTYKVTAASDLATGAYSAKIAGQTLTINVTNYIFNPATVTMIKPYNDNAYANINLWDGSAAPAIEASAISGTSAGLAIANVNATADGTYTLTGSAGGTWTLGYENTAAKCVVTVNAYTIATPASIKKSTGIANIEVQCNGETINAATPSLECTAKPDILYANAGEYNTAKSLTDGAALTAEQFADLAYADKVKTPAVYTVTTSGQTIQFSNASIAGAYKFNYKVGDVIVAQVTITVE